MNGMYWFTLLFLNKWIFTSELMNSNSLSWRSHVMQFLVFLFSFIINLFMIEATERWSDAVSLSHFKVLSEVLISAPPVGKDTWELLVLSNLMEVRISHIVFLSIYWESSISMWSIILLINFSNSEIPCINKVFLS